MRKNYLKVYVYKDVSMLLAAKIVAIHIRDNISELSKINPKWDLAFANAFIARIEDAINNYLGYDIKKELRDATSVLNGIMSELKADISVFKSLVKKSFISEPAKKDEILNVLGVSQYPKLRTTRTQEGFIKMVLTFKTNLTDALRQELVSKGVIENLIDKIVENSNKLDEANSIQEVLKSTTIEKTNNRKALYNSIYKEVSSICVVASSHFRNSKAKQDMFNLSKIARNNFRSTKLDSEVNNAAEGENIIDDANINANDVSSLD